MLDADLFPYLAAGATALTGYLVAARRFSGSIRESEASVLWEESRSIRQDMSARVKELNGLVERLEKRVEFLERTNTELIAENIDLRRALSDAEHHRDRLAADYRRLGKQ